MSLSTASNRVTATGDGVTVTFYFNRLLYDATHLQVYLAGVLQTSGYTVAGVPGASTSVTFSVAPTNGAQVLLLRVVPLTQLTVYDVGGAFPAKTTEKNFDLTFMALQQFDEINDRAVTLPVTSTLTAADIPDPALPANYGKGIKIKGDGTGLDVFDMSATPYTSPLTTKGDLAIYSTTPDRLAVGTNGQFIVADSTTGQGAKWSGDVPDSVLRVVGSADATKKVAFEVDGLTPATTRTVTIPDASGTLVYTSTVATETVAGLIELATQAEVNAMTSTTTALTPNLNKIVEGGSIATTSGTTRDITGVPSGVRRITGHLIGVSLSGTNDILLQVRDAGGLENSGYNGVQWQGTTGVSVTNLSTAFILMAAPGAAGALYGKFTLDLADSTTNTWTISSSFGTSGAVSYCQGSKALSATLDGFSLLVSGVNTFDAGTLYYTWER